MENLQKLIEELVKYPNETQWIEFKHDNYDPAMIGRDISALANSAALYEKNCAYMLWGIDDTTHSIVGTEYDLQNLKKGNQELENWLRSLLSRNANFEYHLVDIRDNIKVGILIIYKALNQTVMFQKLEYIRIGSYTQKLTDYPALQAQLWDRLRNVGFETLYARQDLDLAEALQLLDYTVYFDLTKTAQPADFKDISHYLIQDELIVKQDNGLYSITNLGAILFAKNLNEFSKLARKAVRVIQYADKSKMNILRESTDTNGYAAGFQNLLRYIEAFLPARETIAGAVREQQSAYPIVAVREALANALIHQDFSEAGAGPTIEIYSNRIEITNPGSLLVDIWRIIDNPPKSRNEKLAALMRRLRLCEELGSGWDRMVIACELQQLPAPSIDIYESSTRVTLKQREKFSEMSLEERLWCCYMHACVKYVQGEKITNQSVRNRFGLPASSSGSASRLLKESVEQELIKPFNPDTAPRYMQYIPIWA